MIDKTSTALIVALISILGLTSCVRYNVAEPLDRFSSPEMGTADGNEITVTAGSTWFAEGEYENFILTGQALTRENAEAALLFHHTDGKSGYEVAFRNGAIDGTRKSGSLTSVRNLYRSLAEDGKWFDFEIAVRGHNIMIAINDTVVVCYTEPEHPYRTKEYALYPNWYSTYSLIRLTVMLLPQCKKDFSIKFLYIDFVSFFSHRRIGRTYSVVPPLWHRFYIIPLSF